MFILIMFCLGGVIHRPGCFNSEEGRKRFLTILHKMLDSWANELEKSRVLKEINPSFCGPIDPCEYLNSTTCNEIKNLEFSVFFQNGFAVIHYTGPPLFGEDHQDLSRTVRIYSIEEEEE